MNKGNYRIMQIYISDKGVPIKKQLPARPSIDKYGELTLFTTTASPKFFFSTIKPFFYFLLSFTEKCCFKPEALLDILTKIYSRFLVLLDF